MTKWLIKASLFGCTVGFWIEGHWRLEMICLIPDHYQFDTWYNTPNKKLLSIQYMIYIPYISYLHAWARTAYVTFICELCRNCSQEFLEHSRWAGHTCIVLYRTIVRLIWYMIYWTVWFISIWYISSIQNPTAQHWSIHTEELRTLSFIALKDKHDEFLNQPQICIKALLSKRPWLTMTPTTSVKQ
jgi:hypothetical protein